MAIFLKNIMETLILQKLDESMPKLDCCHCEQCRGDIASYALNRLPPKYVATREGEVFSKLDTLSIQYELDLLTAIMQGAAMVKTKPRHTPEDIERMLDQDKEKAKEEEQQLERLRTIRELEAEAHAAKPPVSDPAAKTDAPVSESVLQSESEPVPEESAGDMDLSSLLEGIDLSDLPDDLPNMEELMGILNAPDGETGKAE